MDPLPVRFGNLIRRRRLLLGVGQEAFADKASLHRTHVSFIERGMRTPSLEVVQKLATALDTTMWALLKEFEEGAGEEEAPPLKKGRKPKPRADEE